MAIPGITEVASQDLFDWDKIPKFSGDLWFVDGGMAASGDGRMPGTAFLTITEGIAAAAAGDAITIKAGTYDENGLDMNLAGLELWGEIGTIITNTDPGTVLTVSGNHCRVQNIQLTQAGQIGVVISGDNCVFEYVKSGPGNSVGFDINGTSNRLEHCHAGQPTTTGFDIGANGNLLTDCDTVNTGAAACGFYINNGADRTRLVRCISAGNGTNGFEIAVGSTDCVIKGCSSGGNEGKWRDYGTDNTWPGFEFDHVKSKDNELDGSGTYNLFQITGIVQINHIWGHVTEAMPNNTTAASLQLFPAGGAAIQITSLAGTAFSNLPVGSMINKGLPAANAITVSDATLGFVNEQTGLIFATFVVGQKTAGIATYIRLNVTEAGTSGAIHWHVDWEPITDDGFVEPV